LVNTVSPNNNNMFEGGTTAALSVVTAIFRLVTTVSTSVTCTGKIDAKPSVVVLAVTREITGWSFTDCTFTCRSALALAPSERDTMSVSLFVPNWSAPGATVATMLGVLLVLKVTLPAGSNVELSVEKDKAKLAGAVCTSGSPIV